MLTLKETALKILDHIEETGESINNFKGLVVGKMARIRGKLGEVMAMTWIDGILYVLLEIKLTRGKAVHMGLTF